MKVIVVTGASSGIGAALAEQLGRRGDRVVLVARREALLRDVAARSGDGALVAPADVTVRADVERVVRDAIAAAGRIDVWVNNAGQGITRLPSALTDADVDDMIRINVKSVLYGTQAVLPHFIARGDGHVINVSSMLGRLPMAPFRSAYSGAKHFVNALTAMFRAEIQAAHPGIQFTLVSPGVVRTDFGLRAIHGGPDSRTLPMTQSAEDVASVIGRAIDTRVPDVYTAPGSQERVAGYYRGLGVDPD